MKQNVIDDYNVISGQQKAAILMLSLDEERSASLFSLMDDEEIKELSVVMASLGKINSNVVEQLLQEFSEKISNTGTLIGTYESTERRWPRLWTKTAFPSLWKKSAARPDAPCGISSAMLTSTFWPII